MVDPGDAAKPARPTADGFADLRVEGAEHDDSWGTFEIPARWKRLMKPVPDEPAGEDYESSTEHPVRYARVLRGEQVLGLLCASAGDPDAGYEPRNAAGDGPCGAHSGTNCSAATRAGSRRTRSRRAGRS
ncbi:hypothetical protein ACIRBY_22265 [Streptomyces sp. NPDC096136]|uniref:hypothetical protein n=1 Tax=Streptomyces sp. NPDC096136 TaxID=3366076 RepID=UPI003829B330